MRCDFGTLDMRREMLVLEGQLLSKKDIFRYLEFMLLRDGDINETMRMRDGYIYEDVNHRIK